MAIFQLAEIAHKVYNNKEAEKRKQDKKMKTGKQNAVILAAAFADVQLPPRHWGFKWAWGWGRGQGIGRILGVRIPLEKDQCALLRKRDIGKKKHQEVLIPVLHVALTFRELIRMVDGDSDCWNWESEAPDEPLVDVTLGNYVIKFVWQRRLLFCIE